MKRKIVSVLLCLTMLGGMLTGCGQKQTDSTKTKSEKEVLNVWLPAKLDGNDEKVWDEVAEPFEKENYIAYRIIVEDKGIGMSKEYLPIYLMERL